MIEAGSNDYPMNDLLLKYYLLVTCVVSLLTFSAYGWDKRQSVKQGRRVPEARLHLLSLLGGWPGALVAQYYFRHKNRKAAFQIVFWLIGSAQAALLIAWLAR